MFLPPKQELAELLAAKTPLVTLESQTPVGDFDVIAFSVSFEWDYVNVLTLLRLAGIPRYAAERDRRHPLVVIGGAVTFVNPEPLAPVRRRHRRRRGRSARAVASRARFARRPTAPICCGCLSRERGFYVPSFYEPQYAADGALTGYRAAAGRRTRRCRSARPRCKTTDALDPPATSIFTPDTEFGSRFLVEVVRGCANLCRFCWAGYNYLPVRAFPDRSDPASSPRRRGRTPAASGSCRSRSATTRTSSASSRGCTRWATRSARRRCASTI